MNFLLGFCLAILMVLALLIFGLSKQGWIALDQYLSCRLNKFAWADEAYSARVWRKRNDGDPVIAKRIKQIDFVFWLAGQGRKHCENAYKHELERKQTAPEYRN